MNKLREFGGVADVVIINKIDQTIGDTFYKANQPYTILKDVMVELLYDQITTVTDAKKSILATQSAAPYRINIGDVKLTDKICNLIMTYTDTNNILLESENIVCDDITCLYTSENGALTTCYISDGDQLIDSQIDGNIIKGSFELDKNYLVFYYKNVESINYNLTIPHYPYFSLQIKFKGNTDKTTQYSFLKFPSVSLLSIPNFAVVNDNILNAPLVFNIIYTRQEEPVLGFIK